jgi:NADPH:quinone reductase-like Zn-dependent oxidoreductase
MMRKMQKQWTVSPGRGKGFEGLKLSKDAPVPQPGEHEVLVKSQNCLQVCATERPPSNTSVVHAASINYRDLIIAKGISVSQTIDGVVPGSDGAGIVEAVGTLVRRFKPGDRVCTVFNQEHQFGHITPGAMASGLGGRVNGTLREYGVFSEDGLVRAPENLNLEEAASLSCAAVTAWNALYGIEGRQLKPGQWVLTQGTGGVSIFGSQLAKAAGARVIATTSSASKAEMLKRLGADHVISYKEDAAWGETAKQLTGGRGVDVVIEVGGATTMRQSLRALRMEGVMSVVGFIGGQKGEQPGLFETLLHGVVVRGILIGSRTQFENLIRAIEASNIHPVINKKVFALEELKDAYQYQWDQKHQGKIIVRIA